MNENFLILSDNTRIRTHNHLIRKRTLDHLAKLAFDTLILFWRCSK